MSDFWAYYVAAIAVISIMACAVLLSTGRTRQTDEQVRHYRPYWDDDRCA
jgi:hypothetical protein